MPNSPQPEYIYAHYGKKLGISEFSVCNIVKKKLKLRSYKIACGHFLNDSKKNQLKKFCRMKHLIGGDCLKKNVLLLVLFSLRKFTIS